jgi:hypothetical protein
MYLTQEKGTIGPGLFTDDNLSPLKITQADEIDPLLDFWDRIEE